VKPGQPVEFSVPFGRHRLAGDRLTPPTTVGTALILHGAGQSKAAGFAELRAYLAARHIETLVFDCIGHGKTGGAQLGTTLSERVDQLAAVAQELGTRPFTLMGFSMGAYVAMKAATALGASGLCLAIPAAYAAQAYDVPFGPRFSAVLRAPRSWEHSDAFDLVSTYTGDLLVVSAEHDQAIPHEIPQTYVKRAASARTVRHHTVARAGHDLSAHYAAAPEARALAYEEIAALCARAFCTQQIQN
jgi:pimeloyl-ACP methyl ester carboxylesterase